MPSLFGLPPRLLLSRADLARLAAFRDQYGGLARFEDPKPQHAREAGPRLLPLAEVRSRREIDGGAFVRWLIEHGRLAGPT